MIESLTIYLDDAIGVHIVWAIIAGGLLIVFLLIIPLGIISPLPVKINTENKQNCCFNEQMWVEERILIYIFISTSNKQGGMSFDERS